jgi:kumamolisin
MSDQDLSVEVPGSSQALLPNSRRIADVDPDDRFQVTMLVRRASPPGAEPAVEDEPIGRDEFARRFGARTADLQLVYDFARVHGLSVVATHLAARTVKLTGAARDFVRAFAVRLAHYDCNGIRYRAPEGPVRVPRALGSIVVGVFGLDTRPAARMTGPPPPIVGPAFTPREVSRLYTFPEGDGSGQTIGIIELAGGFLQSDLTTFYAGLGINGPSVTVVSVDGATNSPDPSNPSSSSPDFEVAMDMQIAGGIAPGARQVLYFAENTQQGFANVLSAAVHDSVNQPSVISISWGHTESSFADQLRDAIEQSFIDAAVLRTTVCASSGDWGSQNNETDGRLHVLFPGSAPHALAVGGTTIQVGSSIILTETVWNNSSGATGGGISEAFPLPSWQQGKGIPPSPNSGAYVGRGVPDVAAFADLAMTGYRIVFQGTVATAGGTSAATPLWAALVAILNQRMGTNLGFLSPRLYALPAGTPGLRDIVNGHNDWSGAMPPGPFNAGIGWDACTGLGRPIGAALMLELLNFSVEIVNQKDECGNGGTVPSGTARFWAKLINPPFGSSPTYAWTSSGGGASIVGSTTSWGLQLQLGTTNAVVTITVAVTIDGVTRPSTLEYQPDTLPQVRYHNLLCRIRRLVHVNWRFSALWDPLRDHVAQPYSPAELEQMAQLGAELQSLSTAALTMLRQSEAHADATHTRTS